MNAPYQPSRIDRLLIGAKAGTAAVRAEVEAMKPELRRRREQDASRISDAQFDRDRDLDERGISAADAWSDEHPMQSSATSRKY